MYYRIFNEVDEHYYPYAYNETDFEKIKDCVEYMLTEMMNIGDVEVEQNFANSLTDGEQEYLEHQSKLRKLEQATMEKQAKDRNAIQEELNRNLLKEIAEAQDAVARQKINEYKAKYLKK